MEYKLKFTTCYSNPTNFKEKDFYITVNHLTNGRYATKIKYSCPANIKFELGDKKNEYPIVTELEAFKRKVTNCIVFDLLEDYDNKGYYDKLFVYYCDGKMPSYGYVMYNTNTDEISNKSCIFGDINDLFKCLNDSFNHMNIRDIYNFYERKFYSVKERFGYTKDDIPKIAELNKVLKEHYRQV